MLRPGCTAARGSQSRSPSTAAVSSRLSTRKEIPQSLAGPCGIGRRPSFRREPERPRGSPRPGERTPAGWSHPGSAPRARRRKSKPAARRTATVRSSPGSGSPRGRSPPRRWGASRRSPARARDAVVSRPSSSASRAPRTDQATMPRLGPSPRSRSRTDPTSQTSRHVESRRAPSAGLCGDLNLVDGAPGHGSRPGSGPGLRPARPRAAGMERRRRGDRPCRRSRRRSRATPAPTHGRPHRRPRRAGARRASRREGIGTRGASRRYGAEPVGGRERDDVLAACVRREAARAAESKRPPRREPAQLALGQGRVGSEHDDDRATLAGRRVRTVGRIRTAREQVQVASGAVVRVPRDNRAAAASSRRDEVPTPDLKPKHVVPVPAPRAPSRVSSARADEIASSACSGRTASARASESQPSKHSPTITLIVSRSRAASEFCPSM